MVRSSSLSTRLDHWCDGDRRYGLVVLLLALTTLALPVFGLGPLQSSVLGLDPFIVNMIGQVMAFALLALSLDLVWGYAGYLSLGHGLFFAVGGYLIGMHMVKIVHLEAATMPTFLRYMGATEFPPIWTGFESLLFTGLLILILPALVAFVIGFLAFRSRVVGVYFAIITQAFVYVAMLIMSRNDTGFGGNNGIAGFQTLLGLPTNSVQLTVGLATASAAATLIALILLRRLTQGPFGRLLIGIRDDEDRLRTLGYQTLWIKVAVWCLSGFLAGLAGMLYVPQVGVASPQLLVPLLSIEIAIWVAIGGRGYLYGAIVGAVLVNLMKFWLTRFVPDLWPFILTIGVLLVVVLLRNGLMDPGPAWTRLTARLRLRRPRADTDPGEVRS